MRCLHCGSKTENERRRKWKMEVKMEDSLGWNLGRMRIQGLFSLKSHYIQFEKRASDGDTVESLDSYGI